MAQMTIHPDQSLRELLAIEQENRCSVSGWALDGKGVVVTANHIDRMKPARCAPKTGAVSVVHPFVGTLYIRALAEHLSRRSGWHLTPWPEEAGLRFARQWDLVSETFLQIQSVPRWTRYWVGLQFRDEFTQMHQRIWQATKHHSEAERDRLRMPFLSGWTFLPPPEQSTPSLPPNFPISDLENELGGWVQKAVDPMSWFIS